MTVTGRELRSTVTEDGTLRLTLDDVTLGPPSADEVIVKVVAAPINPSDLGLLLRPRQRVYAEGERNGRTARGGL